MKSQQAAEREEQLRIKNLVLNYDLREESEQHDGEPYRFLNSSTLPPLTENPNTKGLSLGSERFSASHSRSGQGSGRNSHRARKLQLSDVDWYGTRQPGNRSGRAENLHLSSKI
jgi:regulator of nonsense transcripts 2